MCILIKSIFAEDRDLYQRKPIAEGQVDSGKVCVLKADVYTRTDSLLADVHVNSQDLFAEDSNLYSDKVYLLRAIRFKQSLFAVSRTLILRQTGYLLLYMYTHKTCFMKAFRQSLFAECRWIQTMYVCCMQVL